MYPPRYADITGQVFGRLTALSYHHTDSAGQAVWHCSCSCGGKKLVRTKELREGVVRSCGCLNTEHGIALGKARKIFWSPEPCIVDGDSCYKIPLGKSGKFSLIDEKDFDSIKEYRWIYQKSGYAKSHFFGRDILMHRFILGIQNSTSLEADHINHNRLDNRRDNLRVCNRMKNCWNSSMRSNNTSGYKGVYFFKRVGKWVAFITANKKHIHLGYFDILEEAVEARKKAEIIYFKEFRNA